jgi:hypothetical protein
MFTETSESDSARTDDPAADQPTLLAERRAALAKLGLMAGYVAPATLSLLVARRSVADGSTPPVPPT